MAFKINLPNVDNSNSKETIETESPVIIIGANGSGKTRLGAWIEENNHNENEKRYTHRISAQKILEMPNSISINSKQDIRDDLLYGEQKEPMIFYPSSYMAEPISDKNTRRTTHRWQGNPSTHTLNDYQELLDNLYTDDYKNYRKPLKEVSALFKVKQIWENVITHRQLIIDYSDIKVCFKNNTEIPYQGSEMSDGERVIFYLIGQSLMAPENAIIIVDEPEMHIHKSITKKLWSEIESERQDCLFVYLTHDLDFAASYKTSSKIWVQEYNGENWKWSEIESVENLPDELLLEIKGSRQSIIFVEGTKNSLDTKTFEIYYSEHHIIPLGGCSQVIQATKVFKENKNLHQFKVSGIIDRDRRIDKDVNSLREDNIYCLEVAEIENLFLIPEIIKIICNHLELSFKEKLKEIENFIIEELKKELNNQILEFVIDKLRDEINKCKPTKEDDSLASFKDRMNAIDVDKIQEEIRQKFKEAIDNRNYIEILKLYNRKKLPERIGGILGQKNPGYIDLVIRLFKGHKKEQIKQVFETYLPKISCSK